MTTPTTPTAGTAAATRWAGRTPTRRWWAAAAVAGVVLAVAVALAVLAAQGELAAPPDGLRDPGPLTRWGVPVVTVLRDVAATMTIGLLALAVLAMQSRAGLDLDLLDARQTRVVRLAAAAGAVWAGTGGLLVLLTFSGVTGTAVGAPGWSTGLGTFLVDVELGRLLAGGAAIVAAVAVGAAIVRHYSTAVVVALLAAGALLPVALTGHSATRAEHAVAVNTLAAHLLGVTVWAGGLAGLVVLRVVLRYDVAVTARRFSTLAAAAFAVVAVSGTWRALTAVDEPGRLVGTYGAIAAAKVVLLVALGVGGAVHRRWTLRRLDADPSAWTPFLRLVGAELVVMAVAVGLGVALSRTPSA